MVGEGERGGGEMGGQWGVGYREGGGEGRGGEDKTPCVMTSQ